MAKTKKTAKKSTIKHIRKGDNVIVLTGRDKGKKGSVLRVMPADKRLIVQGVNMVKRHTKQSATQTGGIIEKESTIHVSNVSLVDPDNGEPTRVGFRYLEDGRKVRFAKNSGELID